jgi:hypothetical protein
VKSQYCSLSALGLQIWTGLLAQQQTLSPRSLFLQDISEELFPPKKPAIEVRNDDVPSELDYQ